MTSKNLEKVIQRAISDAAFRRQLQSDPEAALRGFKLTSDEIAALKSSDAGRLVSYGIDQRMSKVFVTGGDLIAGSVRDDLSGETSSFGDPGSGRFASIPGEDSTFDGNVIDPGTVSHGAAIAGEKGRAIRDIEPGPADTTTGAVAGQEPDLRTYGADGRADMTSHAGSQSDAQWAAQAGRSGSLAGDMSTTPSAVRDMAPPSLGSSATYSGDDVAGPGYLASEPGEGISTSKVRDMAPPDVAASQDTAGATRASSIRDSGPFDSRSIDDSAATRHSTIHDSEPYDSRGSVAASQSVQTPDAADRNLGAASETASYGVQSPDAVARNAASVSAGQTIQTPDAAARNAAFADTAGVQSPDAVARNAAANANAQDAFMSDAEASQYAGTETSVPGATPAEPGITDTAALPADTDDSTRPGDQNEFSA